METSPLAMGRARYRLHSLSRRERAGERGSKKSLCQPFKNSPLPAFEYQIEKKLPKQKGKVTKKIAVKKRLPKQRGKVTKKVVVMMNEYSPHKSFLLFSGLVASLLLMLSPILVGVLYAYAETIGTEMDIAQPILALLVVVSMIGAFFGGALFIVTIQRTFLYRTMKLSK